ncbi:Glycine betaine uptake system permease protein YehY [Ephemeroptericola cinctiostellae]|uniref:Glycine betaine uptake system permease protein YehY n=1 Tax=Ephemeroptericola cinctiostellae TaxID=2268024 RepID=A0A345DCJ0_9BURK|nr:ABC transporter permease [Ephemeroptericola cinctiostellae]AXF86078.1 Glycine betaine uptake system permease protein YehY [Ephemeroptericola cinctiostellae]
MPIKIHNKVLLVLLACAAWAAFFLPFLTVAPNRMMTPKGEPLQWAQLSGLASMPGGVVVLAVALLMMAPFFSNKRLSAIVVLFMVSLLMLVCGEVVIQQANGRISGLSTIRVSFGAGFWLLILILWLMAMEAVRFLTGRGIYQSLLPFMVLLPLIHLMLSAHSVNLSLYKEYMANRQAFDSALFEHLEVAGITVFLSLLIGLPVGVLAFRRMRLRILLLNVLNVIQTIPSIALFAFLLAPLAWLASRFPWLADMGIHGVGIAPAVIALTLYSLLPVVRATVVGLQNVPPSAVDAAWGMGMDSLQVLYRVRARLALPVIVSGIRVAAVQAIGLTTVAALIGAGGFGAIMFRGLSSSSVDLIMLGVLPVLALTMCVDAFFKLVLAQFEVGAS